ncbi:MAG: ABC transporter permease [Magnetococcales bacterium]|nr:ABC transporter permease [Magnetococcales bacterium]MBF0156554.1 ABC transporter permease [Magnetococcales bacterium]
MILAVRALAWREFLRFFRQPHRVVGSLAQPLLMWVLLGSGFGASFRAPGLEGVSYAEYFYPGVLLMLALFSGIFATITIIEDRNQGLLQEVLVAPVPRLAIVLGKVIGATGVTLAQCLVLVAASPFLGLWPGWGGAALLLLGLVIATLGFTALGVVIAWNMESTAGFHAVMSVFLLPMWMLSGALFPLDQAPAWLWWTMILNPATHALAIIRIPLAAHAGSWVQTPYLWAMTAAVVWALLCLLVAALQVNRVPKGR